MKKAKTTEQFIVEAKNIHNNFYIYDKVFYQNNWSKIIITCPIHGDFDQTPNAHLQNHGCKKCAKEKLSQLFISNKEEFIKKANIVHNNLFNYDKVIYQGNKKKIEVICKKHGGWMITPANHLTGYGCPQCGGSAPSNINNFILKANVKHNNKYIYNKSHYINSITKILITCLMHGDFSQTPISHMRGAGCPKCGVGKNISKSETLWLNSLNIPETFRHQTLKIKNKRFIVDAFDSANNIIYEFLGDFYHGNPKKFNSDDINPKLKISYGTLYNKTVKKIKFFEKMGYKVIFIWEKDWKEKIKQ